MILKVLLFQAVLMSGFIVNAGICSFLLTKNPLVKVVSKYKLPKMPETSQSSEGKLTKAGAVLGNIDEINSFIQSSSRNDTFPFIISSKGKLIISPRVTTQTLEPSTKAQIAAHYSLVNQLNLSDPKDFTIASGEMRKRNNEVFLISNKSGLFRGGSDTLNLIKDYFEQAGLNQQSKIEFRDYSKHEYADDHITDIAYGRNAYAINLDTTKRNLINEIQTIYNDYYTLVPDSRNPGHVDLLYLTELMGKISARDQLNTIGYLSIFNNEGLYFYKNLEDIQQVYSTLKYIRNILAGWKVLGKI